MHDYAYSATPRSANPPKLEVRIATIHSKIAAVMDSDVDDSVGCWTFFWCAFGRVHPV